MEWIIDRLPTKEDADSYGNVICGDRDSWGDVHWSDVDSRTAWLAFKPAPEPAAPTSQPRPPFTPPGATPEPAAAAVTTPTSQPRRIVSIALDADSVAAVADDGTSWWLSSDGAKWTQMPALPDRK